MKSIVRLTLLLVVALSALAATQTRPSAAKPKRGPELPEPPGAVLVGDSLWMDEAEVANIHWLEYLHFIRKDSSAAYYRSQLPDSLSWHSLYQPLPIEGSGLKVYDIPGFELYPGFRYYPAVGVSYKQAQAYCRWRSNEVNRNFQSAEYLKKYPQLRDYEVTVTYRLPTVAEWEAAAGGGMDVRRYPFGQIPPKGRLSSRLFTRKLKYPEAAECLKQWNVSAKNSRRAVQPIPCTLREQAYVGPDSLPMRCPALGDGRGEIPTYIYSHPPNSNHLYNMIGNVAEMTATPGVARGGAFNTSIKDFTYRTDFPYEKSQAWLGFRCACTVQVRRR